MSEGKNRINNFHKWALLTSAFSMDFLQLFLTLIPLIGPLLASMFGIIGRITFWVWFKILHVGFADKSNRFIVNITITVTEFLPLINALPAWSIGTWVIIRQVRKEDEEYNKKLEEKSQ